MWEYASNSWWWSTIDSELPCPVPGAPSLTWAGDMVGVADSESYEATLAYLARHPNLTKTQARILLFRAKAMRKWKLAPAESARARRDKALDGFAARNELAGNRVALAGIPRQIVSEMGRLLDHWLPSYEGDLIGRFGPGACAERLPHPRRYRRLWDWCKASGSFPSVPTGHDDFDHVVARLCSVPKQYDKDRLITVEPLYNTWAQQAVRSALLKSIHAGPLRGTAMDVLTGPGEDKQRRLALRASLTGVYATLDLSDASDNISWADVFTVMPPWVCHALEVARSTHYVDPRDRSQRWRPTHIYAGMGNATTFVVETLMFTAYVVAFAHYYKLNNFCSTFGDDIICHSDTARALVEYGQCPFFRINATKSFIGTDNLRESCGIFAYNGIDITVPKVDGYQENWSGRLGVAELIAKLSNDPDLWGLSIPCGQLHLLPNWPFVVEGYPSTSLCYLPYDVLPRTRWNGELCQVEAHVRVNEPRKVSIRTHSPLRISPASVCGSNPGFEASIAASFADPLIGGLYLGALTGQIITRDVHKVVKKVKTIIGHEVIFPVPWSMKSTMRWRKATRVYHPLKELWDTPRNPSTLSGLQSGGKSECIAHQLKQYYTLDRLSGR